MNTYSAHFSRFLSAAPGRLHMAAHSHHPWPDVSYNGHMAAWFDAAELADDKWDKVFGEVIPEAQRHVAGRLGLSDPATVAFAPSTHTLLMRLLSCLPQPVRVLTTDAEFHSFNRQMRRLEEDRLAVVMRVAAEPFATFPDRLAEAAAWGGHDLVFFSHVHFNSGYVTPDLDEVVSAVPPDALVAVDGYHDFMAVPTDLSGIEGRAFYMAGGYKYAMAGEGACFLHCPPGVCPRPRDTGWFAGFEAMTDAQGGPVPYATDGSRFLGATLDPAPLYRFNAVQRWLDGLGVTVDTIHSHVGGLQKLLLDRLDDQSRASLVPGLEEVDDRGHFLTFRRPDAGDLYQRLHAAEVVTDHRHDRLRIGFGLYHDENDVDEFCRRWAEVKG
ncbi:MAG TPA: aminotransferase class V-fold PLP-dependent enzyme [Acidimicrobiia bacterium]